MRTLADLVTLPFLALVAPTEREPGPVAMGALLAIVLVFVGFVEGGGLL